MLSSYYVLVSEAFAGAEQLLGRKAVYDIRCRHDVLRMVWSTKGIETRNINKPATASCANHVQRTVYVGEKCRRRRSVQWPVDGRAAVRRWWQSEWESSGAARTYVTTPKTAVQRHTPLIECIAHLHDGGGGRRGEYLKPVVCEHASSLRSPSFWPVTAPPQPASSDWQITTQLQYHRRPV